MISNDHQDQLELLPPKGNVKTDETAFGGFVTMPLGIFAGLIGAKPKDFQYHCRQRPKTPFPEAATAALLAPTALGATASRSMAIVAFIGTQV
jgi:hypothetical protein